MNVDHVIQSVVEEAARQAATTTDDVAGCLRRAAWALLLKLVDGTDPRMVERLKDCGHLLFPVLLEEVARPDSAIGIEVRRICAHLQTGMDPMFAGLSGVERLQLRAMGAFIEGNVAGHGESL